jgi:hypothetical protein
LMPPGPRRCNGAEIIIGDGVTGDGVTGEDGIGVECTGADGTGADGTGDGAGAGPIDGGNPRLRSRSQEAWSLLARLNRP